jgi:hypothetical protein
VTGTFVRNDAGRVVRAFGPGAPVPVIAALGDDLDRLTRGAAKIGLVATDASDRGLIGGAWYGGSDDDAFVIDPERPVTDVDHMLDAGFGGDSVPDLLGIVLGGPVSRADGRTRSLVAEVSRRVPDTTFVVTSTGSLRSRTPAEDASVVSAVVEDAAPVVGGIGSGGLFLDEGAAATAGISTQQVVDAMRAEAVPDGASLFADTFPSFAVRFARYC